MAPKTKEESVAEEEPVAEEEDDQPDVKDRTYTAAFRASDAGLVVPDPFPESFFSCWNGEDHVAEDRGVCCSAE